MQETRILSRINRQKLLSPASASPKHTKFRADVFTILSAFCLVFFVFARYNHTLQRTLGGAAAPIPEKEVCSMRNWFSRHPVSFMAFYLLFYLLWKAPRADFWRLCLPLFAGMTIALACYVILPTGLDLRPYRVYGSDIFAQAVRMLYATDTPLNVCPSIHVFNSVTLMMAYYRSRIFETPGRRWMRPASAVLCVSIIASTVLLKQHSCIDVLLGILLAMVLDTAMTALERSESRIPQRL